MRGPDFHSRLTLVRCPFPARTVFKENNIVTSMSKFQLKIIPYAKNQEIIRMKKIQSINTNSNIIQILELSNKDFKVAIIKKYFFEQFISMLETNKNKMFQQRSKRQFNIKGSFKTKKYNNSNKNLIDECNGRIEGQRPEN